MAITDNLVRYFSLDESSGNAIDAVGGLNLTETGGTIDSGAGKVNGGRDFELADTEYFLTTSESDLRGGNTDFTVAGWFNIESRDGSGFQPVIAKWGATGNEYVFYLGGGTSVHWTIRQAIGGDISVTVGDVNNATWTFLVAWHDAAANVIKACLNDGTVQSTAVDGGGVDSTTQEFSLGGNNEAFYFDGVLDEWGFWRRVLTATEITYLYNSGNGRSYSEFAARRFLLVR